MPDSIGLGKPPIVGGAGDSEAIKRGDVQERLGPGKRGIAPISALDHVTGDRAGIGGAADILLYGYDAVGLIILGASGEMTVGVLVGDILSVRGHKEAFQGQEVVAVRKPGAEKVVVIIGRIGLLTGQDNLNSRPEGIVGSADAIGVQQGMGTIVPFVLTGALVGGIQDYAVKLSRIAPFKSEADDDVSCAPPARSQGDDFVVGCELSIIPGLAVVMGVIFPEDVGGSAVEDIDLSPIGGDGTGTSTIGGDLSP